MVQIRQRLLSAVMVALLAPALDARKFYDDDPLWQEPRPLPVEKPLKRKINEYYDFFQNTFFEPGKERIKNGRIPPAQNVNTLGGVWDSGWYENRHARRPMTLEELVRGPGQSNRPSMDGPWTVVSAKSEGITPGLVIEDAKGRQYLLKFDPRRHPELASAADVIGSKFFYALGYHVPENYIVNFRRTQFRLTDKSMFEDIRGVERTMKDRDLDNLLSLAGRDREGNFRAVASLVIAGELIGPFRFFGVRKDDPNDVVPHEHRRELRGLHVFSAWLNHTDSKALNTLDSVVEENGLRYVRHYLIDFGAILGSDSFEPKSPRAGHVYLFDFKPAAVQFLTLGFYVPEWQRIDYREIPGIGNFDASAFDPRAWKSNYPNPAFDHLLPDDAFWAAKQVMAFTDEQIRALVATGEYTDPRATDWVTRTLIARRDKIGRAYFEDVLPLDRFRVERGRLQFEDLAVEYGFSQPRRYEIRWFRFDNETGQKTPVADHSTPAIPQELARELYFGADIAAAGDPRRRVTVYLRSRGGPPRLVGVERAY
jgi:hypothetical protein